jgi:hypothetical protein
MRWCGVNSVHARAEGRRRSGRRPPASKPMRSRRAAVDGWEMGGLEGWRGGTSAMVPEARALGSLADHRARLPCALSMWIGEAAAGLGSRV